MLMIFFYWLLTVRTICAYPYGCEKKKCVNIYPLLLYGCEKRKCVLQVKILLSHGRL